MKTPSELEYARNSKIIEELRKVRYMEDQYGSEGRLYLDVIDDIIRRLDLIGVLK